MYIPFVFEHILYTVDKYFSQLVAFCTNNFSFDAYGMFLSVYFQNCIIDTRVAPKVLSSRSISSLLSLLHKP